MIHDRMADRLTVRHFLEVIADLYLPRQLKSQGDAVAVGAARCRRSGGDSLDLELLESLRVLLKEPPDSGL